ncbi:response regulator transcription factor [Aneurinibacillus tyrosinisolvens]|uniref:response regulator transcription factor n=1 Tax=Aneurinibacillus tyrosinisolvens TaxID=1443435 RepID=UPI00063FCD0B|nr:response regulator transcription factor [Aneurinibacillus tyrosinisolvens]
MIRILLVDDHPSVGEGSKNMIEQEEDLQVTIVLSGTEALDILRKETFDLFLFDLHMPVISGLELTQRVIAQDSDAKVLIYTGFEIDPHFNLLIEAGASGFISKTATREQLITTLRCALRNEAVVPVSLLKQLRRTDARIVVSQEGDLLEGVSINEKEQDILSEVSRGKSNKEIAQALLMSQRTVEYHLTRIFSKLSVRSRAEAISKAKELGLLPSIEN